MTEISNVSTAHNSPIVIKLKDKTEILNAITCVLHTIIQDNENLDQLNHYSKPLKDIFSGDNIPMISIENFLKRLIKYSNIEESTLIISLIYMDRYLDSTFKYLTKFNVHRLLFTSIVMAIKYNEDEIFTNSLYAKMGGVKLEELASFEIDFLKGINYCLFIDDEVFERYESYINKFCSI